MLEPFPVCIWRPFAHDVYTKIAIIETLLLQCVILGEYKQMLHTCKLHSTGIDRVHVPGDQSEKQRPSLK